ncbi:large ribosomal subunit protein bL21m isoform 2-T2 [Leptosomus discolor]
MIATGQYGRLFAVVHFASKQWKITSEDLIMMDNVLEAECGDRIRMEKVLLVGADDFTLIGRPLLGTSRSQCFVQQGGTRQRPLASNSDLQSEATLRYSAVSTIPLKICWKACQHLKELVRVEATVIEKTESWPKINMRFRKKRNYQRKRIIINPQTVLRINTIEIFPCLS